MTVTQLFLHTHTNMHTHSHTHTHTHTHKHTHIWFDSFSQVWFCTLWHSNLHKQSADDVAEHILCPWPFCNITDIWRFCYNCPYRVNQWLPVWTEIFQYLVRAVLSAEFPPTRKLHRPQACKVVQKYHAATYIFSEHLTMFKSFILCVCSIWIPSHT